jgi:hypothetical protein
VRSPFSPPFSSFSPCRPTRRRRLRCRRGHGRCLLRLHLRRVFSCWLASKLASASLSPSLSSCCRRLVFIGIGIGVAVVFGLGIVVVIEWARGVVVVRELSRCASRHGDALLVESDRAGEFATLRLTHHNTDDDNATIGTHRNSSELILRLPSCM